MARVTFVDNMNTRGELELEKLQPGDLLRFESDFTKYGDTDEGGAHDEVRLVQGDVGEVIEALPMRPGVRVSAGGKTFIVDPHDAVLLVDERDPRITSTRTV